MTSPTPVRTHLLTRRGILTSGALGSVGLTLPALVQGDEGEAPMHAGVAKVDITHYEAGPVNDPLFVRVLILRTESAMIAIITLDVVAIGEIGPVSNDYLPRVRERVARELNLPAMPLLVNASHCHGVARPDVEELTLQAIREALANMVPVHLGVSTGTENRIMENRRLRLRNGTEVDVRHAYSLPDDSEVAEVGPIDPEIGILRLDRTDGSTLAVVYNFACHPIQGVPSGGNTADLTGFASRVIEENLSPGTVALFLQGCGGDVNPVFYKDVDHPRDAETLGNLLGLSTLQGVRAIQPGPEGRLKVVRKVLQLPRADHAERIAFFESEERRRLQSLRGTSLNLKTFLPLVIKYSLSGEFPAYSSHRYLHDDMLGRDDLRRLDTENRSNIERYIRNIQTMEELTRIQTNLALLRKHQARNVAAGQRTIDVEILGLRVGEFVLITFPGELTVQIGLNIKQASPHPHTFLAGYTNGYIYYAPTTEQLLNPGGAQEDCDCLLGPDWQPIFEQAVAEVLRSL